jgi:hypothetical protein
MARNTTLWRGGSLSKASHVDGILAYINGADYPEDVQDRMADALMAATEDEVNNRLPAGVTWYPNTSEIIGPIGALVHVDDDMDGWLRDVMAEAWQAVVARFDTIEATVPGTVPTGT